MNEINNPQDFKWYKAELDLNNKYDHRHIGIPLSYPCKVISKFEDPSNGPYTFHHSFIYKEESECPHCKSKIKDYKITEESLYQVMH